MPAVSIVMPVYNVERYLAASLDSVLAQTFSDIEVICVNDGSIDGSRGLLAEYEARDPRVRVIDQANKGLAGARNTGLDAATGTYLLFLDSDDTFELDMIEQAYARCEADRSQVCIFKIRYVYPDRGFSEVAEWSLRKQLVPQAVPFCWRDMAPGAVFRFVTPSVWNKLFLRQFLVDNGLRFHEDLKRAEDLPFSFLVLALASRITVIDRALVNYLRRDDSLQSTVHEHPLEICHSLKYLKEDMTAAGVFEALERDFVSVALYQCLYTLESVRTPDAFNGLYLGLKETYFSELGIDGRSAEYFFDRAHYETLERVRELSPEAFLLRDARALKAQLDDARHQLRVARQRVNSTTARLKRLRSSVGYRIGQVLAAWVGGILRPASRGQKARR